MGIDHTDVLRELPVTIKNSRLLNCLLCELGMRDTQPDKMEYLGLSARYSVTTGLQSVVSEAVLTVHLPGIQNVFVFLV
jgi:hypothetical protein